MVENTNDGADNIEKTATDYDDRISEIIGGDVSKTEEAPETNSEKPVVATVEAQDTAKGEGTNQGASDKKTEEEKTEDGKPEPEKEAPAVQTEDASGPSKRLDKRIVTKAIQNATLSGHELDEEQVMTVLATKSPQEKKAILMELLKENATLRGDENGAVSEEDIEAIAESRAEQKFEEKLAEREVAEMEKAEEVRQTAWHDSLAVIIKENPALDEKGSEYNPKLAEALQIILSDDGKTPRYTIDPKLAWEKVQKAAGIAEENAKLAEETNRSKALSGAMSGTGSKVPSTGVDWDEIARLAQDDPEEYKRRVMAGEIPE